MNIEERNKRVEENLNLVHDIINKLGQINNGEYEDLFQIGCLRLIKCANSFDESRGLQFSTYAYKSIKGSIMEYLNKHSQVVKRPFNRETKKVAPLSVVSLNATQSKQDHDEEIEFIDLIPTEDSYVDIEIDSYLDELNKDRELQLTKEERIVVDMLLDGYTKVDIGKFLKCSYVKVFNIFYSARYKIANIPEIRNQLSQEALDKVCSYNLGKED